MKCFRGEVRLSVEQQRSRGAPREARGLAFSYLPYSVTNYGPSPEGRGLRTVEFLRPKMLAALPAAGATGLTSKK